MCSFIFYFQKTTTALATHIRLSLIIILIFNNLLASDSKQEWIANFDEIKLVDSLKVMSFSDPVGAVEFAYEILEFYPDSRPSNSIANVFFILGEIFHAKGLPVQALEYYTAAENEKVEYIGDRGFPWLKVNMGNVYFAVNQMEEARDKYTEAYGLFSSDELSNVNNILAGKAVTQNNLGMIEQALNNYTSSLKHFRNGLMTRVKMERPLDIAHSFLSIGKLYLDWTKLDSSLYYFDKADSITLAYNLQGYEYRGIHGWGKEIDPLLSMRYAGNSQEYRANLFMIMDRHLEALSCYKRAIAYYQNWPRDHIHVMGLASQSFLITNNLDSALNYLDKGLAIASVQGLLGQELDLLEKKRQLLSKIGDQNLSIKTAEKIIALKEEQMSAQMDDMLYNLELKTDLMGKQRDLKKEKERGQKNMLASILGFSILILVVLNFRSRYISSLQEKKIAKQQKQVAESDRFIAQKDYEMAQAALRLKENELSSMSAYILQKNDLINTFKREVDYHINLLSKSDQKIFYPLRKQLKSSMQDDTEWSEFEKKFTNVYPGLLETLANKYPQLTSSDLKLCTYLRMNQNTKEMAQFTGLSIRALESRRYRLRKKLSLDPGTDLVTFLHTIGSKKDIQV